MSIAGIEGANISPIPIVRISTPKMPISPELHSLPKITASGPMGDPPYQNAGAVKETIKNGLDYLGVNLDIEG